MKALLQSPREESEAVPLEPKGQNGVVWNGKEFQTFKILDASFLCGVHHAS